MTFSLCPFFILLSFCFSFSHHFFTFLYVFSLLFDLAFLYIHLFCLFPRYSPFLHTSSSILPLSCFFSSLSSHIFQILASNFNLPPLCRFLSLSQPFLSFHRLFTASIAFPSFSSIPFTFLHLPLPLIFYFVTWIHFHRSQHHFPHILSHFFDIFISLTFPTNNFYIFLLWFTFSLFFKNVVTFYSFLTFPYLSSTPITFPTLYFVTWILFHSHHLFSYLSTPFFYSLLPSFTFPQHHLPIS